MMTQDEFQSLAQQLLQKSRAKAVTWENRHSALLKTLDNEAFPPYYVVFPKSLVRVTYVEPKTEPNYVEFELCTPTGIVVAGTRASEDDPLFPLLYDLYREAHKSFTHWDDVYHDVMEGIKRLGQPAGGVS